MNLLIEIMKKCKKCNVEGNFVWDKDYHENSGKWRLLDLDIERPHQCPTEKIKVPEEKTLCPQCNAQTRKPMPKSKLQEHIKKYHLGFY